MPVQILKLRKKIASGLMLAFAASLVSCASQKQVAVVDDPDAKRESVIPWNKQEKWETSAGLGGITDKR